MKMGQRTETQGLYVTPDGYSLLVKGKSGSLTTWKRKRLVGATKAEALFVLAELQREASEEAEAKVKGESAKGTVSVFARRYAEDLGRRVQAERITQKTSESHVFNLERFVVPYFGRKLIKELRPKEIRDWMRWLEAQRTPTTRISRGKKAYDQVSRSYAKATLASAWRTLRAFFSWVSVEADLQRNPVRDVRWDVEAPEPKAKATLTKVETEKLLEAARLEKDPSVRMMLLVALTGALRSSELSALRREDVDLERGTITINKSHVEGRIGKPKTEGSRRVVMLPPEVLMELRAFLRWQDTRMVKGLPILFPTTHGTHRQPSSLKAPLARCAERAGITKRLTSHALRRTSNNLLRQTAGEIVARAVTGHVTQEMTVHYSNVDHDERTAALRAAFGGALGPAEV